MVNVAVTARSTPANNSSRMDVRKLSRGSDIAAQQPRRQAQLIQRAAKASRQATNVSFNIT